MRASKSLSDIFWDRLINCHKRRGSLISLSKKSFGVTERYLHMYKNSLSDGSDLPEVILWI